MTTSRILVTFLLVLSGCAATPVDEPSGSSTDALKNNGGGGTKTKTCEDKYGDCYIDCSVKYPESGDSPNNLNSEYRQGCLDSCDGSYDLCESAARTGRNGGFHVPPGVATAVLSGN